jgi:predicted nucleotidyltransferase
MQGTGVNQAIRCAADRAAACEEFVSSLGDRLAPVLRRYNVCKAILFGSFARGEPSPHSDLDLILVQRTDRRFFDRYEGLLGELGEAVPERALEVLIYTPEELERMRSRRFIATALREGRLVFESE